MRLKFCQCIIQRFLALINENFQKKNLDFVLDYDQNINCGYMYDPVLMSTHNLCFGSKVRKIGKTYFH